jgi:hypothetical protein
MDRMIILAIAVVIAGALSGGIYAVSGAGAANAFVVNRLTGSVWICSSRCEPVPTYRNSN